MDNRMTLPAGWVLEECPICKGLFSNPNIRPSVTDGRYPPLVLPREILPDVLKLDFRFPKFPRYEDYPSCPHCRAPLNITLITNQSKEKQMNIDQIPSASDERIIELLCRAQQGKLGEVNPASLVAVIKRFMETDTELKKWQEGGVTEEMLRKHDGYIRVGCGCELAVAGTTEKLHSVTSVFNVYKNICSSAKAREDHYLAVIQELQDKVAALEKHSEHQRERIRYLEGATNHVGGTPLTEAKKKFESLHTVYRQIRESLNCAEGQDIFDAIRALKAQVPPPDTGDDALLNVRRLRAQIRELESDLKATGEARDIERKQLDMQLELSKQLRNSVFALQDELRKSEVSAKASRQETREFKEYNNALFEFCKEFMPVCGVTNREIWNDMLERGKALSNWCRTKLLSERDDQWAKALEPVTGSLSMTPETAAARVGITIKNTKVNLLQDLSNSPQSIVGGTTSGWFHYQAEKLKRSSGNSLDWERPVTAASGQPNAPQQAGPVPTPPDAILAELRAMMDEPHFYGKCFPEDQMVAIKLGWYKRLKEKLN